MSREKHPPECVCTTIGPYDGSVGLIGPTISGPPPIWINKDCPVHGQQTEPLIPASDLEQVIRERDEAVRLLRPFAEGAHLGAVGGRPPWEFVSANDYEAARAFLNNLDNRNE